MKNKHFHFVPCLVYCNFHPEDFRFMKTLPNITKDNNENDKVPRKKKYTGKTIVEKILVRSPLKILTFYK